MIRYAVNRLLIMAGSLLALVTLSFLLVSLIPGDPAVALLGDYASPEKVAELHAKMGLDKPLGERYLDYVGGVLHGDLGQSYFTGQDVSHDLLVRLPSSILLLVPGLVLAVVIGLALGTLAAYRRRRLADRVVGATFTVLQAIPEFVIGLVLLYVCFFSLRIVPAPLGMLDAADVVPRSVTGSVPIDAVLTGSWPAVGSIAAHAALPVVTIAIFFAAYFGKTVRGGLSQALRSPQVEFAEACGLPRRQVFRYAMSDVRTSLLTFLAILFGAALGGAAIVESLFAWPGVGYWSLQGVLKGDVPVIQGFVLVMGVATLAAYLLLDLLVLLLDPRVRARTLGL